MLQDVGWNQPALFHFGQAWIHVAHASSSQEDKDSSGSDNKAAAAAADQEDG